MTAASLSPVERLERATWDLFWVPRETVVINRPELLAIATAGKDCHLNTAFRFLGQGQDVSALVAEVGRLHQPGPSRCLVSDHRDPSDLEDALSRAGYAVTHEHDARILAVADYAAAKTTFEVREVTDLGGLRDSFRVSDAAFGARDRAHGEAEELALYCGPASRSRFFVAYDGGEPVSAGGINAWNELGIALLWGGGTIPSARGRGAYSAVVGARLAWAARRGIALAGVYARTTSSSPIVSALGFAIHGRMSYWER